METIAIVNWLWQIVGDGEVDEIDGMIVVNKEDLLRIATELLEKAEAEE